MMDSFAKGNLIRFATIAVALAAGSLSLGASAASAGTPINPVQNGVVHSCFRSTSGRNLRLIDPTQTTGTCAAGETPLQWGQQGPKGDPGAPGAKGDPGAAGAPGLSEYQVVPVSQPISAAGGWVFDAACPNGKTAISGGYTLPGGSSVQESHPRDGDPTVWRLAFTVPGPTTIKLYLQCARTQ